LGALIGWEKPIFKLGAQPFLLAELFKLTLLTILLPWIIKINIKVWKLLL
jgi:biotin transport system substrate-specific component